MKALVIVGTLFVAGLLLLTVTVTLENGITALTVVSMLVIAVMAIGILGALFNRPNE